MDEGGPSAWGSAREYERVADAIADADWRSVAGRREFTAEAGGGTQAEIG